jgi:uncharacterized membrane protein
MRASSNHSHRKPPSLTRNVNRALAERQTLSDHLADRVARFGGSWTFILIFIGVLVAWAALNTIMLPRYFEAFDPYPYIFLNLILSMLAALQAPIILMSQNRQADERPNSRRPGL